MEWKGRRQSDNVEDQRGSGMGPIGGDPFGRRSGMNIPIGRGGGIGSIILIIIVVVVLQMMGVDVTSLLNGGSSTSGYNQSTGSSGSGQVGRNDEMKAFVSTVLAETEDTWKGIFQAAGETYTDPKLVMFSGNFPSACGTANRAMGPFYCPLDQKVYLDTDFFREMETRFGASGDFAQAYVIAHEVGHHVQNLIGVLPKFNRARQSMSETEANRMSVRVELQADCFAGIWAKYTDQKGILDAGDIDEALNAANQIGDDTLQKESQGYVVPDSFTHGTSAQRASWFKRGFQSGKMAACDTFSGNI